jgi:PAS domain S-box-containing protein
MTDQSDASIVASDTGDVSNALLIQLAEGLPQIVYVTRADGRIEFFNMRWTDYTGLTSADSEVLISAVHPEDLPGLAEAWTRSMATCETLSYEFRLRRKSDGAYRWFLTRSIPVRDATGVVVRWFGTSTDIDDTKMAGVALAEANRRKDEFLATLSHELRNPLAPIRNALNVLQLTQHDAQTTWAIGLIDRQMQQMTRLIDDLLDISRIGSGKIDLRFADARVSEVVRRAVETCAPLCKERGHRVTVAAIHEELTVWADADRLTQVCFNLLHNAAKYSAAGSDISISVAVTDLSATIRVRDAGIGIAPERIARIFDMYVQVEEARQNSRGGLGVGLALVKRIVELHSGSVRAISEGTGHGSVFDVTIPRYPQSLQLVSTM